MKVREKGPKDQPWIETLLNERWGGGGKVILHGEVFDARSLPALIAGERGGLATFQIRRVKDMAVGSQFVMRSTLSAEFKMNRVASLTHHSPITSSPLCL